MGGLSLYDDGKIASMTHSSGELLIAHECEPPAPGRLAGSIWAEAARARALYPQATVFFAVPEEHFKGLTGLGINVENLLRASALLGVELHAGGSLRLVNDMAMLMFSGDQQAMKGWEG